MKLADVRARFEKGVPTSTPEVEAVTEPAERPEDYGPHLFSTREQLEKLADAFKAGAVSASAFGEAFARVGRSFAHGFGTPPTFVMSLELAEAYKKAGISGVSVEGPTVDRVAGIKVVTSPHVPKGTVLVVGDDPFAGVKGIFDDPPAHPACRCGIDHGFMAEDALALSRISADPCGFEARFPRLLNRDFKFAAQARAAGLAAAAWVVRLFASVVGGSRPPEPRARSPTCARFGALLACQPIG